MKNILLIVYFIITHSIFSQESGIVEYSKLSDTIMKIKIDESIADTLYSYAKNKIDFIDYSDCYNCDLRAHLISYVIENKFPDIKLGKAWLFADSKRASKVHQYSKQGYSILSNKADCYSWSYHVAPIVIINKDTIVIDPSTQRNATNIYKWSHDLIQKGFKGFLVIKQPQYLFFPQDTAEKFDDLNNSWIGILDNIYPSDYADILAEKLTIAYFGFFEPSRFYYYKNKILDLLEN